MFYDHERWARTIETVLEENWSLHNNAKLAEMCVEAILAVPIEIPARVVDLAIDAYDPGGVTAMRRERMRTALEAVLTVAR